MNASPCGRIAAPPCAPASKRVIDLDPDCLLARTAEGTRKMSSRAPDLAPRLRSALFVVSGQRTFRDLMDLADGGAHVLETQIRALLKLGLIEVTGR